MDLRPINARFYQDGHFAAFRAARLTFHAQCLRLLYAARGGGGRGRSGKHFGLIDRIGGGCGDIGVGHRVRAPVDSVETSAVAEQAGQVARRFLRMFGLFLQGALRFQQGDEQRCAVRAAQSLECGEQPGVKVESDVGALPAAVSGPSVVQGAFMVPPGANNATEYQGSGFTAALTNPIVLCQGRKSR